MILCALVADCIASVWRCVTVEQGGAPAGATCVFQTQRCASQNAAKVSSVVAPAASSSRDPTNASARTQDCSADDDHVVS